MSRLLFCAPASGGGKTTVTCGVLQALINRSVKAVAYKSGPDYIDPMFHSQVIGAKSHNLDLFLMGETAVHRLLSSCASDEVAILEGAMGYYDGIAMGDTASAYHLAKSTQTPAVLVLDARGRALSAAAVVKGMAEFRADSGIQGVILSRISPMLYPRLKACIEGETGIKVYGFVPNLPDCTIESRHLGLVTAAEIGDLKERLDKLAIEVEKNVDLDGLLTLAETAPKLQAPQPIPVSEEPVSIAVAQDEAFCFYYADGLAELERQGAKLIPFSPLADASLPDCDGLYLGGGYPELYAEQLSQNTTLLHSIKIALEAGLPCVAECGGFLYLHAQLEGEDGVDYPMVGYVDSRAYRTPRLGRFGYITVTAETDGLFGAKGTQLAAHEFHYWDSEQAGTDFYAQKPQSNRGWDCAIHTPTLYAGFPHFHFGGDHPGARRFITVCRKKKEYSK